jgi:hypothetical protein
MADILQNYSISQSHICHYIYINKNKIYSICSFSELPSLGRFREVWSSEFSFISFFSSFLVFIGKNFPMISYITPKIKVKTNTGRIMQLSQSAIFYIIYKNFKIIYNQEINIDSSHCQNIYVGLILSCIEVLGCLAEANDH